MSKTLAEKLAQYPELEEKVIDLLAMLERQNNTHHSEDETIEDTDDDDLPLNSDINEEVH